jgi:RHS repeat-associated protein
VFQKWQLDGADYDSNPNTSVVMNSGHTLTAVYTTPTTYTLNIDSSNPSSGVSVSSYVGSGSYVSASTPTSRSFSSGTTVGVSCPATLTSGNVFQKWQLDGVDYAFNDATSVLMNAPHTLTAFYASPGLSLILTSPNGGENWTAGTSQTISWTVNGTPSSPISYFGMNYSLNGGVTWQIYGYFAAGSASSGSWSIPLAAVSSQALVQIKAVNSSGVPMFWNQSASVFTINSSAGNPTSVPTCNNRAPSPASAVTVNFNGSASTGSSSSCGIASWLWTFDDGTSSTAENPSHTFYPAAGTTTTYNVYLAITDCNGKPASAYLTIYITGQALGNNPTQPTSKDPVNLATGNYTYNHVDLQIPGRGLPFEFQRYYNSKDTASTGLPLGFGWTDSYNIQLLASDNAVVIAFGDGHQEVYAANGAGGYISQSGIYNVLTTSGSGYTLTTKEQQKYNFNSQGQLTSIVDKNNNTVALVYTGNNLTTITNTVGRTISFAYNANNCLTNITDPLGRTVRFAYDANTNLISVTDTRGGLTQFRYDQYHQLTNAIDPRGNAFVSMMYDDEQRVVSSQKDALQNATTFSYDFVNKVTTVTDAMNNVSYNYYDGQLRVVKTADSLGNTETFQYDTNNNRTMVVDKNGAVTLYAYDGNGNVIGKTNSFVQTTTIAYDALNNPTNRFDALNGQTVFRYDTKGNLTNSFNSIGKTNTYQYDAFGEPIVVTDSNGNGNSSTNTYDSFGNLIKTQDALGDTSGFTYDIVGRKTKQVDALGRTNSFIYDNADNLTASVNALGKSNLFTFDGNNNRVTATDFNGNTTTSVYDPKDRLIMVSDPIGDSITNDYDALDRKIHVWDAMGNVTRYGYDANGNLLAVTNAAGAVTFYAYDPNGNRTNVVDALGNSATNVFDSLNRLVSTLDPLGHTTTSVYDALGRRIQGIDALNRTNFSAYDSMGRLTNFTDTAGGIVVNSYDNVGNRLLSTDPNGHTSTNVFDALNRLSKTTDPAGGVLQLSYDAVGNLISRKDPDGNTTTYQCDANNRRTKMTYPTGTPVTFGYDANGNRTSMTDSLGTTTYVYDALNRLTSVTDCYGQTVSYGYDKNGNRASLTYPGGKTVRYVYDPMNRLKSVTDWLNNTTTYNYDADGHLTSSVNPNGTAAVYQYDPANRLIALTNTANSAIISSYQYTLDAVGNHSQVNQTEQLPTIPVVEQAAYAYDNDNKMTNSEGQAQGFDANGNMISINPTNLLFYDYENRLTQDIFAGTTNTYQYDGAGNRMSANRSGIASRYVLDRNSPLSQVLAETDASGNTIYYYIYGLGLISRIDANNNAEFYHYDSRGSTIALTDASGQITEAYAYDPFGRPINGEISDNRFRYLGRHGVMDEENGFLYIRARYYSTRRGRFITKDPTTGKDGDSQRMNRYIYALNNPINLIDVNGAFSIEPLGVAALEAGAALGNLEGAVLTALGTGAALPESIEVAGIGVASGNYYALGAPLAVLGGGIWSSVGSVNQTFKDIDAMSANIPGAFFNRAAVLPEDEHELLDPIYESNTGMAISAAISLSNLPQTIEHLQDSANLLEQYQSLFSPDNLALAKVQLLDAVTALYSTGQDLAKLNNIVATISGGGTGVNKPFIPETIDPNRVAVQPQQK